LKRIIVILLFSSLNLSLIAQIGDNYFYSDSCKASVETNMNCEFSSSSISNKFLDLFLFSDHIDEQNKNWMFASLHSYNSFGADINGGLTFITFPDTFVGSTDIGLFVRYNKYYHVDMSFTRDLFELFFDGNKRFAGKEANLSNSSLNMMNYEQMQFGIFTKLEENNTKLTYGVGVSVNNGYRNTLINIKKGALYTDANAEYIDFSANYEVNRSDFSKTGNNAFKGIGASLNLYYSFETERKNIFDLEITDFGFIKWNKHSQKFARDTSLHFEGINVSDILNIEGNIFNNANPDSIINSYTYSDTTHSYSTPTPSCLKISYLYNYTENFRIEFGIKKKFFSHYDPLLIIKSHYLPCKRNIFSFNLCFGGYSKLTGENHNINAGIEYAHDFGKGLVVLVGSDYLNGLIYPYSTTAKGVFFSLKKYFL